MIRPYTDIDAVIDEVNGGAYGLTASIWSKDRVRARQLAQRIDTGVVTINDHLITPRISRGSMVRPQGKWPGILNVCTVVDGFQQDALCL